MSVKKIVILFLFQFFSLIGFSQKLTVIDGDTINYTNALGKKEGKWFEYDKNRKNVKTIIGLYKDGKKEGN